MAPSMAPAMAPGSDEMAPLNGADNGALDWRLKNDEMTPFNGAWTGQLLRLKPANNGARFIVPMEAEASYLDQVQQENSRGLSLPYP